MDKEAPKAGKANAPAKADYRFSTNVILIEQETALAKRCAAARQEQAKGFIPNGGLKNATDEYKLKLHIDGALGEVAAAKALGCDFQKIRALTIKKRMLTVGTFGQFGDVGGLEIKTSANPNAELCVRPKDDEGRIYILVIGSEPSYRIAGWLLGRNAKQSKWLKDKGDRGAPAFFVPQSNLRHLSEIPKERLAFLEQ